MSPGFTCLQVNAGVRAGSDELNDALGAEIQAAQSMAQRSEAEMLAAASKQNKVADDTTMAIRERVAGASVFTV